MNELINEARQYILQQPQNKKEVFRALCSLNLMNAAIKHEEYRSLLSYGFIKPQVSRLVDFCISHDRERFAEELFYDSKQRCMYVRCYGFQFSFHSITISKTIGNFARSALNIPVEWDGIRLQPMAKELFIMAKRLSSGKIDEENVRLRSEILKNRPGQTPRPA